MSEKLQIKKPIYPIIGIMSSIIIFAIGLVTANDSTCLYFLCGVWFLFLIFGYYRACLSILPFILILGAIFAGITFLVSRESLSAYAAFNRITSISVAVIPGLAISPAYLTRNLLQIKIPRMIVFGMLIAISFFHLLVVEIRQIKEAMRTRGAGSFFNLKIFYRAFLIPLIVRLVNISDTLALSIETRGFSTDKAAFTVYKPVKLRIFDIIFLIILITGAVLTVII